MSGQNKTEIYLTKQELIKALSSNTSSSKYDAKNARVRRSLNRGTFLKLRSGLYIRADAYINEPNKTQLTEYTASKIYKPSYITGEYILGKYGMLLYAQGQPAITSITTKTTRSFINQLGTFIYQNVRSPCYTKIKNIGISEAVFSPEIHFDHSNSNLNNPERTYHVATKARALFDYLYLHASLKLRNQKQLKHQLMHELGIQWSSFTDRDFKEFDECVWKSNAKKMINIHAIIRDHLEESKPDAWLRNLLDV